MKTIKGSTDDKGMFRAENPNPFDWEDKGLREFWEADHPPLPCYTPSNELVISRDNVKVKPWFAVSAVKDEIPRLLTEEEMNNYHSFEEFKKHKCMLFTYQVYLTVSPHEKEEESDNEYHDAIIEARLKSGDLPLKANAQPPETNMSDVPLSPMKPYYEELGKRMMEDEGGAKEVGRINNGLDMPASKELKSAEEIKAGGNFKILWPEIADGHLKGYDGRLHQVYTRGTIQEMFNAQFATEGGGGKDMLRKVAVIVQQECAKLCDKSSHPALAILQLDIDKIIKQATI